MSPPDSRITRRHVLSTLGSAGAVALAGIGPSMVRAQGGAAGRVVVVGGGFGGATAARYLKLFNPSLDVTLVEPAARFFTCPFSNLVLGGLRSMDQIGHGFDGLRAVGIKVIAEAAADVDSTGRTLALSGGGKLHWDKLVLSPGIDMRWGAIAGYDEVASLLAPHAWKAGPQTILLKSQLICFDLSILRFDFIFLAIVQCVGSRTDSLPTVDQSDMRGLVTA